MLIYPVVGIDTENELPTVTYDEEIFANVILVASVTYFIVGPNDVPLDVSVPVIATFPVIAVFPVTAKPVELTVTTVVPPLCKLRFPEVSPDVMMPPAPLVEAFIEAIYFS